MRREKAQKEKKKGNNCSTGKREKQAQNEAPLYKGSHRDSKGGKQGTDCVRQRDGGEKEGRTSTQSLTVTETQRQSTSIL